jgi:hypothetical protein
MQQILHPHGFIGQAQRGKLVIGLEIGAIRHRRDQLG